MTPQQAIDNITVYSALHNGVLDSSIKVLDKCVKALELIKERFVWLEDGKLYCGRMNDFYAPIEEEIEGKEEMELLKEVL